MILGYLKKVISDTVVAGILDGCKRCGISRDALAIEVNASNNAFLEDVESDLLALAGPDADQEEADAVAEAEEEEAEEEAKPAPVRKPRRKATGSR